MSISSYYDSKYGSPNKSGTKSNGTISGYYDSLKGKPTPTPTPVSQSSTDNAFDVSKIFQQAKEKVSKLTNGLQVKLKAPAFDAKSQVQLTPQQQEYIQPNVTQPKQQEVKQPNKLVEGIKKGAEKVVSELGKSTPAYQTYDVIHRQETEESKQNQSDLTRAFLKAYIGTKKAILSTMPQGLAATIKNVGDSFVTGKSAQQYITLPDGSSKLVGIDSPEMRDYIKRTGTPEELVKHDEAVASWKENRAKVQEFATKTANTIRKYANKQGEDIQKYTEEKVVPTPDLPFLKAITNKQWVIDSLAENLPSMLISLGAVAGGTALGMPTVGAAAGFSTSYLQNTGDVYEQLRPLVPDDETASKVAVEVGIPVAMLDVLPLDELAGSFGTKDLVKKAFIKEVALQIAKQGTFEATTETMQQIIQNSAVSVYDKNTKWFTGLDKTAFISFLMGGGAAGISTSTDYALQNSNDSLPVNKDQVPDRIEVTPQDLQAVLVSTDLINTPEGKELMKKSLEAAKTGQNLVIANPNADLTKEEEKPQQQENTQQPQPTKAMYNPENEAKIIRPDDIKPEEVKYFDRVEKDLDTLIDEYHKQHGNVINTDKIKAMLDKDSDYNVFDSHRAAGQMGKVMYNRQLQAIKDPAKKKVLGLIGGTGSGKTSVAEEIFPEYGIILDSTGYNKDFLDKDIQKALDNGFEVDIQYVYRPAPDAWENGVLNRLRHVPVETHLNTHIQAPKTYLALLEKYKDNPDVTFHAKKNETGQEVVELSVDDIKKIVYNREQLKQQIYDTTDKHYKAKDRAGLTDRKYEAIRGKQKKPEVSTSSPKDKQESSQDKLAPSKKNKTVVPNQTVVYHGTFADFSEFDPQKLGSNTGAASSKMGFFFATNKDVAISYASDINKKLKELEIDSDKATQELDDLTGDSELQASYKLNQGKYSEDLEDQVSDLLDRIRAYTDYQAGLEDVPMAYSQELAGNLKEVTLDFSNPYVKDYEGAEFRDESYAEVIKKAKEAGHDAVIFTNTYDGANPVGNLEMTDIVVVFDKKQIKVAEKKSIDPLEGEYKQYRIEQLNDGTALVYNHGKVEVEYKTRKEADAYLLGRQAYEAGKSAVPAQDDKYTKLMEGVKVGEGVPISKAWMAGYDKASSEAAWKAVGEAETLNNEEKPAIIQDNGQPNGQPTTSEASTLQPNRLSDTGDIRPQPDRGSSTDVNEGQANEQAASDGESGARPVRDSSTIGKVGRQRLNEEATAILESQDYSTNPQDYTLQELDTLRQYSGAGGKESAGAEGKGLLSEYYTPQVVVDKVWDIANSYVPNAKNILEPSVGAGALLSQVPDGASVTGYEYQRVSGTIAQILNPQADIKIGNGNAFENQGNFETHQASPTYDLVIGNPPFGDRASFLMGKGEESKINRWEEYFIKKGLDSLKDGGTLVYVVNSSFLDKSISKGKEAIAKEGKLVKAIRLPEGIFADTSIGTDIVVFKKQSGDTDSLVNGNYFAVNPQDISGTVQSRTNRFGRPEQYVSGTLEDVAKFDATVTVEPNIEEAEVVIPDKPLNGNYYIHQYNANSELVFVQVDGKPVDIGLNGDTFIFKNGNKDKSGNKENWNISEGKTGQMLVTGVSREDVIAKGKQLKELIDKRGDKFEDVVEKAAKGNGLSPRYTEKAPIASEVAVKPKPTVSYASKVIRTVKESAKKGNLPAIIRPDKKTVETVASQVLTGDKGKIDKVELELLKHTKTDGSVEYSEAGKQYLNYQNGKYYHDLNYFSGDIYAKLEDLEANKEEIVKSQGQAQYDKQLKGLTEIKPIPFKIRDITFDPLDRYVTTLTVETEQGYYGEKQISVVDSFLQYLARNKEMLSYGVDSYDIVRYIRRKRAAAGAKEIMGKVKADAERLFNYYIRNILDGDIQQQIVDKYNREKNSYVTPKYLNMPVVIKDMAKHFRGLTFKLSPTQASGVSFLTYKGVGLVAYGVGVGKTHTLLTATMVVHQKGWNKRPVFIVPKSTITETWLGTIKAMFPTKTIVNLGGLTKPDMIKLIKERGEDPKNWIKDGEISVLSHEGLLRLKLTPTELQEAISDLGDALWSEQKNQTKRGGETQVDDWTKIAGEAQAKAIVNIADLGFDHISVDEVHNFRKIFKGAKPEDTNVDGTPDLSKKKRFGNVIGGVPSKQAQQLFIISQYILKRNNGRGVFLASATPFENHATEVYNILSLMARDRMRQMGIYNINDFFALYSNFESELDKNIKGEWEQKEKMKAYKNIKALQKLLREFVDYQVDPTLVRPQRRILTPQLQMSALQEENLELIQEMLNKKGEDEVEGAVLKASTYSVANSISPYFIKEWHKDIVTPEELIDNSPKLKYSMELIKHLRASDKTKNYGTFFYIGDNGKDYHDHIAWYAVKYLGFKEKEVAVLNGDTKDEVRDAIKEQFNSGEIKLLIGGSPTKEGIDLQNNGYVTINVALGWNPTEMNQVEGRVWRQGNKRSIAPLVYPLVENSGDITIYNKFEEKGGRINDLFSFQGEVFDIGELDPKEKRLALMTKPEDKARVEIENDKAELEMQRVMYETDIANYNNLIGKRERATSDLERYGKLVAEKKNSWGEDLSETQFESFKKEVAKAKRTLKHIEEYLAEHTITDIPTKIKEVEQMRNETVAKIEQLQDTYEERLAKFKSEYDQMIASRKSNADHIADFIAETRDLKELSQAELDAQKAKLIREYSKLTQPKAMRSPSGLASTGASKLGLFDQVSQSETTTTGQGYSLKQANIDLLHKYMGRMGYGEGNLTRGALGNYDPVSGNIRSDAVNDLSVNLHEISHLLDTKYDISQKIMGQTGESANGRPIYDKATKGFRKEITKLYTELYPTGKETHKLKKRVREGFATLIQKYAEMPETITNQYPSLVNAFLKPDGKYYDPIIGDLITDVRKIISNYQGLSALDKIGAYVTSQDSTIDKESFLTLGDKVRTATADYLFPLEKMDQMAGTANSEKSVYLHAQFYRNANTIAFNNIRGDRGYWGYRNGDFVKLHDFNMKTLLDFLFDPRQIDASGKKIGKRGQKLPIDTKFSNFLVARDQYFNWKKLEELEKVFNDLKTEVENVGLEESKNTFSDDSDKSLYEQLQEAAQKFTEMKRYLEKNPFTKEEVQAAYEENKDDPDMIYAAKLFDSIAKEHLRLANDPDVQLLSNTQYEELTSQYGYAPMKRQFYDELVGNPEAPVELRYGKGKISSLIRRTGGNQTIINPVFSLIRSEQEVMQKSLRQMLFNRLGDIALSGKLPTLMQAVPLKSYKDNTGKIIFPQEKEENIIMARKGYKRVPVLLDSQLHKPLLSLLTHDNIGIVEQLLRIPAQIFTKGTTALYPSFAFTNFFRDQLTAVSNTKNNYKPIVDTVRDLYKVMKDKESAEHKYFEEYVVFGGLNQLYVNMHDIPPQQVLETIGKEASGIKKAIEAVKKGEDILAAAGKYSELITRYAEYANARKSGKSQVVALEEAGRVTAAFHHIGSLGGKTGQAIIRSLPFLNATWQTLDQTARQVSGDSKARQRYYTVTLATIAAMVASNVAMLLLASDDQKEQYKDLAPEDMAKFLHFADADGQDLIRLPVNDTQGVIGGLINMAVNDKVLKAKYTGKDYAAEVTSFLPPQINPTDWQRMIASWIPQGVKPEVMIAMNKKDYPSVRDLETQGQQKLPDGLRTNEGTSLVAKEVGKALDVSPIKLDYFLLGHFGRTSGFMLAKPGIYNPFVSLHRDYYFTMGRRVQTYYDVKKENDEKYTAMRQRAKTYSQEEVNKIVKTRQITENISDILGDYRKIDIEKQPDQALMLRDRAINLMGRLE